MPTVKEQTKYKTAFSSYPSVSELLLLAEAPFDLSKLSPERIAKYHTEVCGLRFLFGTERINDEVMRRLRELAKESQAVDKMRRMQSGEIINFIENAPSERRAALHTATRDFFGHPQPSQQAREAADVARQEVEKLRVFLAKVEMEKKFNEIIVIGIGGSDLGPRAHYLALQHLLKPNHKVHFITNLDPDDANMVLKTAVLNNSLVVVISKSGTTMETATNEEYVRTAFKEKGLKPENHFLAVTCPGTPMDNPSRYLKVFYMWEWVGGRFSTTSMAGGVMLAFAFGFDVFWEFLRGAHEMDKAALEEDPHLNLPLLAALLAIWNHNFLGYSTSAIIPYSQALWRYPAHIQQVEMESNGKRIDRHAHAVDFQTAPIVWGEAGTNAQHSFFQLLHQGTTPVPLTLIGFKDCQTGEDKQIHGTTSQEKLLANLFAQALALATGQNSDNPNQFFSGNRPSSILLGKRLSPHTLGSILSFFEHRAAFQGFIWWINSFDQEGVQLGKKVAGRILQRFSAKKHKNEDQTPYPLGDALLAQLDTL